MYQLDQAPLPNWTTPLDPVDLYWQHDAGLSESSHLPAATGPPVSLQTSSRPADISWPESIAARDGEQTQVGSTLQPDHMWEPIPSAPSDFREEVLNLFSASEAPQLEPAKHESAQSAPTPSGLTAASEKSGNIRRDVSALSRTRSQPHTSEQKQANARESQKRFRMRQKARAQAIEAQLASTVAELCNLRVRQQQLESRNLLLEKCSRLSNQQHDELAGEGPYERLYIAHETDASENGPSVTISVRGARHSMTVQEISVMPVSQFAFLWTEYIREIGACLIQLEQKQDLITQHLMEKLTVESSRLIGLIKLLNHDVHQAMLDGKLDPNLANTHKLGSAFYTNLTRLLSFSEEQMQDIMVLRRIYVIRRGLHATERRQILAQAGVSHHQMPLPNDNLARSSDLATQIKNNARDDYRVYHRVACALRRGVYTTKQWAIVVVQSYPYLPVLETHLETMAADRGEPSKAELLGIASGNYMAAEWRHLNKYLEVIASTKSHDYIPFSDRPVQPAFPMAGMPIGSGAAARDLRYMMA